MSTEKIRTCLAELTKLREDGTPGTWSTYWGDHIGADVEATTPSGSGVTMKHPICEMHDEDDRVVSGNADWHASPVADAALIVAAVEALSRHVTALTRVLDLVDAMEQQLTSGNDGLLLAHWAGRLRVAVEPAGSSS